MTEWRNVRGWPHQVSDAGEVRSPTGVILKPAKDSGGYHIVTLCDRGRRATALVHRLVCEAFHGPAPAPNHEVGHRDGSRTNSAAENLRWVTAAENAADRDAHGRTATGARHHNAKLDAERVRVIRTATPEYGYLGRLAAEHGVSRSAIKRVRSHTTWLEAK